MLEKHQDAPDQLETPNVPIEINWERLRDAPLVGIDGIIDWNQLERERLLGLEEEYTWTEENEESAENDEDMEDPNENEDLFYGVYDEQDYEGFMDDVEWIEMMTF